MSWLWLGVPAVVLLFLSGIRIARMGFNWIIPAKKDARP